MTDTDEAPSSDALLDPTGRVRQVDAQIKAIAERRLAQIIDVLGLEDDHFEQVHKAAAKAFDGSLDRILAEQARDAVAAFMAMQDPLVRARLVELLTALAEDDETD